MKKKKEPEVTIILSVKDASTVANIIAGKAMEMHKKGTPWMRGEEMLSCVDKGNIANKIQEKLGSKYDFDSVFSGKKKSKPAKKQ